MVQAGIGSGYAQQIISTEIDNFVARSEALPVPAVTLSTRIAFNPNVTTAWFTSVMGIIDSVTMLAIILAGAAVVREREHGTMDHLLVMPLTPFEIAMSKIWANAVVITGAVGLSLTFIVQKLLGIPIAGSVPLFMCGVMIYLFFATAVGLFLATIARTMPRLGLLYILVAVPPQHAFWRQHAPRKHAAVSEHDYAGFAVNAFCVVCAGDPLSRRRL